MGIDWHRRGQLEAGKVAGGGLHQGSGLLPEQRWFFKQMHSAHTDTQVIINEAASLYPPPPLLAPLPTVLHSGFISSLWINRDTLSVQRRVVIKVFSCYPRVKETSTPHFFIIDVRFRRGRNTFPIQVMLLFWGSCATAPGVRHQPMPCNEVRDKAAFPQVSFSIIKLSMIYFFRGWRMWCVLWR